MCCANRLPLFAAFVLSSHVAAQESSAPAIEAAMRDARQYGVCVMRNDWGCIENLTDQAGLKAARAFSDEMDRLKTVITSRERLADFDFYDYEVARPWELMAAGDRLYAFVPYFETFGNGALGLRYDRMAYLIGASDDDGESWRFIPINKYSSLSTNDIDRVIPGYGGGPRPEVLEVEAREPKLERSQSLQTTERGFVLVNEAFAYTLQVELLLAIEGPVSLTVSYDNPANRDRLGQYLSMLTPGQQVLKWQSPPLSLLVPGETYEVVIEGSDPATGRVLFEHQQPMLFQPSREIWRSVMSKPPQADASD